MKTLRKTIVLLSIIMMATALPVSAQTGEMMEHKKPGARQHERGAQVMKYGQDHKKGHHDRGEKGHLFAACWKETLSDAQKKQMDKMHLELKKSITVLKAQLNLKKAELNSLVANDAPGNKSIDKKIDEILKLEGELMRKKYEHKVEMRTILTPEQRVSFDMQLIEKSKEKKGNRKY